MKITNLIQERGIEEVLHFTTSNGLIGILTSGYLLAHSELPDEKNLTHITQLNCPDRSRDIDYHHYVNLSISRVNSSFFSIARNKWHATKDLYWCILSFGAEIMSHEGVLFSTTNNAYPYTERSLGGDGLDSLFASPIRQFATKWVQRSRATPDNFTTCSQAEVLYPRKVPIQYLNRVYVPSVEILSEAEAHLAFCVPHLVGKVELIVDSEQFA